MYRLGTPLYIITCLAYLLMSACTGATPSSQDTQTVSIVKQLATVYLSPTPNAEQLQATRFAVTPTRAPATPSATPPPTAYVGIFIGEAQLSNDLPRIREPLVGGPTPLPTSDPRFCPIALDPRYLGIWLQNGRVSSQLGCPIQQSFGFFGEIQIFENGLMYRRPETDEVWAFLAGNNNVGRYVYVERPAPIENTIGPAPAGLVVPTGSFGSVWSSVADLRDSLGWARTTPQEVAIGVQRFVGGTFFLDATSEQAYALVVDGTLYGPFSSPSLEADTSPDSGP